MISHEEASIPVGGARDVNMSRAVVVVVVLVAMVVVIAAAVIVTGGSVGVGRVRAAVFMIVAVVFAVVVVVAVAAVVVAVRQSGRGGRRGRCRRCRDLGCSHGRGYPGLDPNRGARRGDGRGRGRDHLGGGGHRRRSHRSRRCRRRRRCRRSCRGRGGGGGGGDDRATVSGRQWKVIYIRAGFGGNYTTRTNVCARARRRFQTGYLEQFAHVPAIFTAQKKRLKMEIKPTVVNPVASVPWTAQMPLLVNICTGARDE